jgi:hypothetical protein
MIFRLVSMFGNQEAILYKMGNSPIPFPDEWLSASRLCISGSKTDWLFSLNF